MYINFWYAAAWSKDLGDQPMRVRMLDHDFVLFRDSKGKANCLSDTCVHRGASLSAGKVKGDCVQCPYHGWQFDGEGQCKKIPSLGPGSAKKVPPRGQVDAYPVEEKYGLIHVFLGDLPAAERPPLMPIPEWDSAGWRPTNTDYKWDTNYERNIENGLDPAHNEFVHPTHGYSGENDDYEVREPTITDHDWGHSFMLTFQAPPIKNPVMKWARNFDGDLEAGSGHVGPNNMWTFIHLTPTRWIHQYVYETPIDERHTQIFLICMRNTLLPKWVDSIVNKRNFAVAEQDRVVIERLQPVCTPPSRTRELMMPADRIIGLYRDRLKQWEENGWRIDVAAVKAARERGDTAYAIPSPRRRESKAWVLESTPMVHIQSPVKLREVS